VGTGLAIALLFTLSAFATEMPWYVGKTVAQLSIESTAGGQDDYYSLLRVDVGEPIDVGDIREDLNSLYLVGDFKAVEAHIHPIEIPNSPVQLRLVYKLSPAPRISEIKINGAPRAMRSILLESMRLSRGQVFYYDEEAYFVLNRAQSAVQSAGWPVVGFNLRQEWKDGYRYDLVLDVVPNTKQVYGRVSFRNLPENLVPKAKWKLFRLGLMPGRRFTRAQLQEAREMVRELLVSEGWTQARVNLTFAIEPNGKTPINIFCELGLRHEFSVIGAGVPRGDSLLEVLEVYPGDRITESDSIRFARQLESHLESKGYPDADVNVEIVSSLQDTQIGIDVVRGERHRLSDLRFEGSEAFSNEDLVGSAVSAQPLLRQGFGAPAVYSEQIWISALRRINEVYRGLGYLEAKISPLPPIEEQVQRLWGTEVSVVAQAKIEEGPQTRFGAISQLGGIPSVMEAVEMDFDGPYRPNRIEEFKSDIIGLHQNAGFLNVTVEHRTELDSENHIANVHFRIQPYSTVLLRSVILRGNQKTRPDVITSALAVEVGQPLTPESINQTRQQLYNLDLFRTILIDQLGDDSTQHDLLIRVIERPNLLFSLGGGVTTDQGVRATFSAGHRNLFGKGNRLTMLGLVGYAWDGDKWVLDQQQPIWRSALRYTAPRWPIDFTESFVEALFRDQLQANDYRLYKSGGSFGLMFRPTSKIELLTEYRVREISIQDYDPGLLVVGDPWNLPTDPAVCRQGNQSFFGADSCNQWWSGVHLSVIWDGRDDPLNPSSGSFFNCEALLGDGGINKVPSLQISSKVSSMWSLESWSFRLGSSGGMAVAGADNTLPFQDRFFLGGPSSLRGFDRNSIGPANYSRRPEVDYPDEMEGWIDGMALKDNPAHWVFTGGDYFLLLSMEGHVPLAGFSESMSAIGFIDVGKVGFKDGVVTDSKEQGMDRFVRYSFGVGTRYASSIGPLAIDLGINPSPIREYEECGWFSSPSRICRSGPAFKAHFALGAL
jgi:outer membrane protein insertion porin family